MNPISDLHAEARKLAASGVPIFPCAPGSKVPWTAHGFHDASTDPAQIDAWWGENDSLNIAFSPHEIGLGIIDLDGQAGEDAWEAWQVEHGHLPLTYVVRTPRGGRHLYYRGVLPATQSKLGEHVDTRGVGSYALVPPSVVGGKPYVLEEDRPHALLPPTVQAFLDKLKREHVTAAREGLDQPQDIARASRLIRDIVAAHGGAKEGERGDERTFALACEIQNLGISQEKAYELLTELWNPHCDPPWEDDELRTKVENAARYSQNEAGAWAVEASADVFQAALSKLGLDKPDASTADLPKRRFKRYTLDELWDIKPPAWLLPDLMPAEGVSLLYGQPGTFKTYIAIDWAVQLAQFGTPVLYVAGEGVTGVIQRFKARLGLEGLGRHDVPIEIIRDAPWASDADHVREFLEEVREMKPSLVVLDTLARSAIGLDENSAKEMGMFVAFADAIRKAVGCAVLVIHHTGKDGKSERGSGALRAGVDAAFEVTRPEHVRAVSLKCVRQKDAQEREEAWTYECRDVGGQTILNPISTADYRVLTTVKDQLAGKEIGKILREIGATSDNPVTTAVLAYEIIHRADPELGDEAIDAQIGKQSAILAKLARDRLEVYCVGSGSALRWFKDQQ